MTELVAGKSLERARSLRREDVIEAVGGVPQASIHAAQLAIESARKCGRVPRLDMFDVGVPVLEIDAGTVLDVVAHFTHCFTRMCPGKTYSSLSGQTNE